ncbi:hypothetical protein [Thermasporomyces composti]|uniref:hypothetical protein n=1 Tax=Thermasporomyces composti TaxID=696763 RepID=UPI000E2844E2|nr:hypothetical protein [Thermasporomyces composti]
MRSRLPWSDGSTSALVEGYLDDPGQHGLVQVTGVDRAVDAVAGPAGAVAERTADDPAVR